MTVSWTKLTLIEARGFISNYTIAYYPISMSRKRQSNIMLKVVSSESNSAIIDGLDENSAYAVQMSANTGAGEGPVGVPVSVSIIGKYLTFFHVILHFTAGIVLLYCVYFFNNFNISKDTKFENILGSFQVFTNAINLLQLAYYKDNVFKFVETKINKKPFFVKLSGSN